VDRVLNAFILNSCIIICRENYLLTVLYDVFFSYHPITNRYTDEFVKFSNNYFTIYIYYDQWLVLQKKCKELNSNQNTNNNN